MLGKKTAIVAGGFGTVGRSLIRYLETLEWDVVGIGRRFAESSMHTHYVQVDLTDANACR